MAPRGRVLMMVLLLCALSVLITEFANYATRLSHSLIYAAPMLTTTAPSSGYYSTGGNLTAELLHGTLHPIATSGARQGLGPAPPLTMQQLLQPLPLPPQLPPLLPPPLPLHHPAPVRPGLAAPPAAPQPTRQLSSLFPADDAARPAPLRLKQTAVPSSSSSSPSSSSSSSSSSASSSSSPPLPPPFFPRIHPTTVPPGSFSPSSLSSECVAGDAVYYSEQPNSRRPRNPNPRRAPRCRFPTAAKEIVAGVWHCLRCEAQLQAVADTWADRVTTFCE